jgi:hypothetical protein
VNCVKRRSVLNDPIGTTERSRGAVVQVNVLVDLEALAFQGGAPATETPAPKAPVRK